MTRRMVSHQVVRFTKMVGFALLLAASPAVAQQQCGPRPAIIEALRYQHHEDPVGAGMQGSTALIEVWASEASGTWTVLRSFPNGVSCIMASGGEWAAPIPKPAGVPG